jgi:hypothetical protein
MIDISISVDCPAVLMKGRTDGFSGHLCCGKNGRDGFGELNESV